MTDEFYRALPLDLVDFCLEQDHPEYYATPEPAKDETERLRLLWKKARQSAQVTV